jgi:hypothetical protein
VLRVLNEIKEGVVECSPADSFAVQQIEGIIDVPLITQQVESGSFEWEACMGLVEAVVGVVQSVQESRRTDETRYKYGVVRSQMLEAGVSPQTKPKAFSGALEFLLGRVSALRIDCANQRWGVIVVVVVVGVVVF